MQAINTRAKIMEVFRSIQGEGPYAGAAQVFVRFFECNMHCSWCDTPASIGDTSRNYKELGSDELLKQVKDLYGGCHSVSITGGEPLMQVEFLKEFLPKLRQAGMVIYLETNGTLPNELRQVIDLVDIVAMDLKLPTSTGERAFWDEHKEFLKIAIQKETFIKVVVTKDTRQDEVDCAVDLVKAISPEAVFILQPNYFDMKEGSVNRCVEFHARAAVTLKNARMLPQIHKFMKLR